MRKEQIKVGMKLRAWKALWGEFIIIVKEITTTRPARIKGEVVEIITPAYGSRTLYPSQMVDVGIIDVKPYNEAEETCLDAIALSIVEMAEEKYKKNHGLC